MSLADVHYLTMKARLMRFLPHSSTGNGAACGLCHAELVKRQAARALGGSICRAER